MRVLLLLTLLLAAGSQASVVEDLGDALKNTLSSLLDSSQDKGQRLLEELKLSGTRLTSQQLQKLVSNMADAMTKMHATAKRQLDPDVQHLQDPDGSLYAHADELKGYLQTALQAASRLDHPETYQQTIQDFLDQLDHIVASHQATTTPAFRKRQLDPDVQHLQDPDGSLYAHADELKGYLQTALQAASRLDHPETYQQTIQDFLDQLDHIVASHQATTTPAFRRRQLDPDVQHLQDPDGSLYAHADELKGYLQTALQAANRLDHPETYQQTIQDFLDQLDHIVASHQATATPAFRKRQLDPDVQHLQDPDGSLYAHADELKGYLQTALQAANRLDHPETYQQTIQDFLDQLDHIVASHRTSGTPAFRKR